MGNLITTQHKIPILIGIWLLLSGPVTIQLFARSDLELDSLALALASSENDSNKVILLNKLSTESWQANPDLALKIGKQALNLADSLQYKPGQAQAHYQMAEISISQGNYDKAIEQCFKSNSLYKDLKDDEGIGKSLFQIGTIYYQQRLYKKAEERCLQAIELYNKILDQAEGSEEGSLPIQSTKNRSTKLAIADAYNLVGNSYTKVQIEGATPEKRLKFNSALINYKKAMQIRLKLNEERALAGSYNNIALTYKNMARYYHKIMEETQRMNQGGSSDAAKMYHLYIDSSLAHYSKSLKIFSLLADTGGLALNNMNVGRLHLQSGILNKDPAEYEKALPFLKKSLQLYQHVENIVGVKISYFSLSELYERTEQYEEAFKYHKLWYHLEDSMHSNETTELLLEAEAKHSAQKQEQDNILLRKDNELHEQALERVRLRQYALGAIILLIGALLVIFMLNHSNFKRRKLAETDQLLVQIEQLKSQNAVQKAQKSTLRSKFDINRELVDQAALGKLNETDWKVLNVICDKPTTANKEIAEEVFLSVEGVKSSFKKMYDLFEITAMGRNKKIALVLRVMKISEKPNQKTIG